MLFCDQRFHAVLLRQSFGRERKISFFLCLMIIRRRPENYGHRKAFILSNIYKNLYVFLHYYLITQLEILSTLQIIPHLVYHKPTNHSLL